MTKTGTFDLIGLVTSNPMHGSSSLHVFMQDIQTLHRVHRTLQMTLGLLYTYDFYPIRQTRMLTYILQVPYVSNQLRSSYINIFDRYTNVSSSTGTHIATSSNDARLLKIGFAKVAPDPFQAESPKQAWKPS